MEHVMNIGKREMSALLVLVTLIASAGQRATSAEREANHGEFNYTGDVVVLPLTEQNMQPRVAVDIGDGEQYEFIVDTGASVNVIDSHIAEEQGYEVIAETEIGAPGGPQIPANIVKVPIAHVGDATIIDAEFVTMDISGFSRGMTQGVLGLGLFRDHLLTFDQSAGEIRVSRESLSADDQGVLPYDEFSELIQIDVDIAGIRVASHIDTGAMGSFMLPDDKADSLPLQAPPESGGKARLVGGSREIKHAKLDGTIQFAGLSYEDPKIAFMKPAPEYGNIGSRVLGELVVSVDQKNHLIGFQKSTNKVAATSGNKPRRLGVGFQGMPGGSILTIASVEPGSLGEQAGFAEGDILLSLNDKPTEQYDMPELGHLIGGATPLSFSIERDGVLKTIEVP